MGNSCCEPNNPGSLRRKRNMAHEPPSDFLGDVFELPSQVAYISRQRMHVVKTQFTVRKLNTELEAIGQCVERFSAQREKLLGLMKNIEEERKTHRGVAGGIVKRIGEFELAVKKGENEAEARNSPDFLKTFKLTYLRNHADIIELLVSQFIKYLQHYSRIQQLASSAETCILRIASESKAVVLDVSLVDDKVKACVEELDVRKMDLEKELDKIEVGGREEMMVGGLLKLYEETEIEISITRRDAARLISFCTNIREEAEGIQSHFTPQTVDDIFVLSKAPILHSQLADFMESISEPRLLKKVKLFVSMVSGGGSVS